MKDNEGYINIVAVMQKYFGKQYLVTGHTVENYEDNQVVQ